MTPFDQRFSNHHNNFNINNINNNNNFINNNNNNNINIHKSKNKTLDLTTSSSSLKKYYNPYQRSLRNKQQPDLNLHQVELGIVDGSSLNPSKTHSSKEPSPPETTDSTQQKSIGLLTKCVDWLFKLPLQQKSKKKIINQNQPPSILKSNHSPDPKPIDASKQITHIDFKQQPIIQLPENNSNLPPNNVEQHLSSGIRNHSNFLSLPSHNKSRSIDNILRSQSPFVPYHAPILNSSSSSSSLRSTTNSNPIHPHLTLDQEPHRRRPSTSHATLHIPISTNQNSIFNSHLHPPTNSDYQKKTNNLGDPSVRSLSPLFHRATVSPSAHIVQSSSLSHLGRLNTPLRTLNSTLGLSSTYLRPPTHTIYPSSIGRKREYDRISISPDRLNQSSQPRSQSNSAFPNDSQTHKKQMFWDPALGFATREQRDKILRENELKLRKEQGRPFPTNEAEKILQILEMGRNPNPFLKTNRHLPTISVPTPSSTSAQRRSLVGKLNRSNGLTTDLDAIYEEQALNSNPTIIAPISKRLHAERIKRMADKKGHLRAEIKKRNMFEEKRKRQSHETSHPSEPNGSRTMDSLAQNSTDKALRSVSVDTAPEVDSPPRRRRSTRKIGKLTSESSKAKVNQGRKSRSQSLNEEEVNQDQVPASSTSRLTRNGAKRAAAPNRSSAPSNSSQINGTVGKTFKSRKSPSPIQEEDEELANQSVRPTAQIPIPQHTTCLHPAVRSSSMSLQTPKSIVKSSSISSLRPGRTFSSRRHAKAKVFSALEEDLPVLNSEDEEEADQANEKLKKIKLPSTFLSSFKLDKFTPPPPRPQVDPQPSIETQETQGPSPTSKQDSPKRSVSNSSQTNLFGRPAPQNNTPVSAVSSAATLTNGQTTMNTSFPSGSNSEKQAESTSLPGPSTTLFSLSNVAPVQSGNQAQPAQQSISSFGGFSRIPSDKAPPNFFGQITTTTPIAAQPTNTDASISQGQPSKSDQQAEKNPSGGLFSFQSTNSFGAIAASSSGNTGLFTSNSVTNSNPGLTTSSSVDTPNVATESTATSQNNPQLFTFGTQTSSQSTTGGSDSAITPAPTLSAITATNQTIHASNGPSPPTVPTFTFGGVSNPPASTFGSQPEATNTGSDQMKADPAPVASSATPAPFSSSAFAFGGSQTSSTTHQITNTQSDSSQSGMFGIMSSTTQPPPSIFGNSDANAPPKNSMSSASGGFNFNVLTKPATDTPFGVNSSSQPAPSSFVFGAPPPSTSNLTVPAQSTAGFGLFGTPRPAVAIGTSSAPPISFTFGNPSSSSNTGSSPFIFGANNSSGVTSTPTPSFGQPSSNNASSTTNVFTFGAGNSLSTSATNPTQNQSSSAMFGLMSDNNNNNNNQLVQNSQDGATSSSNSHTSFNFGGMSPGFNNNNSSSLFGSSSGVVPPPANNLFGNNNNLNLNNGGLNGSAGTNNKSGLFGANLFGASSSTAAVSANNNNDSNHHMMETNSMSNPTFGVGGATNNGGSMGGFGNNNGSNTMTTTNSNPFSPFGGSNLNHTATQNNPQALNFSLGAAPSSSTPSINGAVGGNSDLNSGIHQTPVPAAPGGFVFNMGSGGGARTIKKLPTTRKVNKRN